MGTEGERASRAASGNGDRAVIEELGYEQARDELAEVVRALEVGGLSLDDALALWERGERLARRCEQQLAGARDRVDAVLRAESADGDTDADA
jgi:exodeoxyribonuclease VII small subunit